MPSIRHSADVLICLYCLLILSCDDVPSSKIKTTGHYKTLQIEINSPYSCYNKIQMDSAGMGTTILGFRDASHNKTIKKQKQFFIHSAADKMRIQDLISRIEARSSVVSTRGYDLYNFTLVINDKQFINKYGQDSLLDNVLKILLPYVQSEDSGQCDYFNLLKQTLANESEDIIK